MSHVQTNLLRRIIKTWFKFEAANQIRFCTSKHRRQPNFDSEKWVVCLFLNGLFYLYVCSFLTILHNCLKLQTSPDRTQIVRIEGKHTKHLTTASAHGEGSLHEPVGGCQQKPYTNILATKGLFELSANLLELATVTVRCRKIEIFTIICSNPALCNSYCVSPRYQTKQNVCTSVCMELCEEIINSKV